MKTRKTKFNVRTAILLWLMLPALFFAVSSCNRSSKDNSKSELSEEIQDVKEELDEIAAKEKQELKNDIESIVADFNNQVNAIESSINKGNKKLSSEAQEMLNNLKAERDTLNMKLDEIENQTEQKWSAFKKELEHDTKQFASSVEDFFKDNK
ncbi:MAG: hypothetical protein R6W78_06245 [Bacteroidales bacterium]